MIQRPAMKVFMFINKYIYRYKFYSLSLPSRYLLLLNMEQGVIIIVAFFKSQFLFKWCLLVLQRPCQAGFILDVDRATNPFFLLCLLCHPSKMAGRSMLHCVVWVRKLPPTLRGFKNGGVSWDIHNVSCCSSWFSSDTGHHWTNPIRCLRIQFWFCRV